VTSGSRFETVDTILQGLKRGDKGSDLGLKLNDSLGGGGIGDADFGSVLVRE
jgi:hypothetical protein